MTENPVEKVLKRTGWTQTDLANAIGITQANISLWLSAGKIPSSRLLDICKISGFYPNELDPEAPSLEQIELARRFFEGLGR